MASADVTLSDDPHEFEVDTNQRTATLNSRGGWLKNSHGSETVFINTQGGTVTVAQPAGAGHLTLKAGAVAELGKHVSAFTFDALNTSYLQWSKSEIK